MIEMIKYDQILTIQKQPSRHDIPPVLIQNFTPFANQNNPVTFSGRKVEWQIKGYFFQRLISKQKNRLHSEVCIWRVAIRADSKRRSQATEKRQLTFQRKGAFVTRIVKYILPLSILIRSCYQWTTKKGKKNKTYNIKVFQKGRGSASVMALAQGCNHNKSFSAEFLLSNSYT